MDTVGIVKLDDNQISQLSQPTIRYTRDPRYSAGAIEMFHNLHCLHHLRMHVWAEQPEIFHGRDPTKDEGAAHIGTPENTVVTYIVLRWAPS
jgi:hypothetical protein